MPSSGRVPSRVSTMLMRALALFALIGATGQLTPAWGSSVTETEYHGWNHALRLDNGVVEAIVVPAIGRVMSFRFHDGGNVFWEESALHGQKGDASGKTWVNFGGDKTWPAPEAEWKTFTGHKQWMPPAGFDGMPARAEVQGDSVILTSAVDPSYGVRVMRNISLARDRPVMTITASYERVAGPPAKIGVWVITQFIEPVAVYVPVRHDSAFPGGYFQFRERAWPQLTTREGLLKITRDPKFNHKLGSDADRMLWVGEKTMCLVSSPRVANAEYPDRGASAEVYTNADPKRYVELETLGPLALVGPGDRIEQANTYTLIRRTSPDSDAEARRILQPQP